MLPGSGVTGGEPFLSGTLGQKKVWLQCLYKMMERARVRSGDTAVDRAIVAAGSPADSMTKPFTCTDEELQQGSVQARLENVLRVLLTFPGTRSPVGGQNSAPTVAEAAVISTLMDEVENCYTEIAAGKADQQIEKFFSVPRRGEKAEKVRELFGLGVVAVKNVKKVLAEGNPPPGAKRLRILIDLSGELAMKEAAALSSPRELMLAPSYVAPPTSSAERTGRVDTLLHECMHVVSAKITDPMYWPNPKFFSAPFDLRINNADHFTRVAIEYRETKSPSSGGGGPSPGDGLFKNIGPVEDKELLSESLGMAQDWVRAAWIYCLDAWNVLKRLHDDPNHYDHVDFIYGWSLRRNMKLISQISHATLHERSQAPGHWLPLVTAFDLAALEETIMDLAALVGWSKRRTEVQVVVGYPATAAPGVLYVTTDALFKTRDPQQMAASFLEYGFSRFNQAMVWFRPGELIGNIKSMIYEKNSFRSLPDKPENA
jgi:hypothetical protein